MPAGNSKSNNYLALLIILIPVAFAVFFFMRKDKEGSMIDEGNRIAIAVDTYKEANGKLPHSMSELHISADTIPFHYEMLTSKTYKLSFTAKDGKTYVFDSERKEWE